MTKEIYIIFEGLGDWSDYREQIVCACGTEGKAKQIIKDLKENGPKLPYFDQSIEKFEEFQDHLHDFDEKMEDEGRWDTGGRWYSPKWDDTNGPDFIPYNKRTAEEKEEERKFRDQCHKEYDEERLKYMQEKMPGTTKKMMDDWEYLSYYMTNPSYNYKKVEYRL